MTTPPAGLRVLLDEILGRTPLKPPRLSDPTPEDNLLEDLLLAAAVVGLRTPALDAAAVEPAAGVHDRQGALLSEDGEVFPAAAARRYREAQGERALADLRAPRRLLARHPEILPVLLEHDATRAALEAWVDLLIGQDRWPTPEEDLTADALAARLRQTAAPPDPGARLLAEAAALGAWCLRLLHRAIPLVSSVRVGRALAHVVMRSPFFGADEELLGLRLGAHRRQLGAPDLGLRPEIFPLLLYAYGAPSLGSSVLDGLRLVAARTALPAEARLQGADLGATWPVDLPRQAPQAARFLLQRSNASWLAGLGPEARTEVFLALREDPAATWIWSEVFADPGTLTPDERPMLLEIWRSSGVLVEPHLPRWCMGGLGLAAGLSPEDQARLLEGAGQTSDRWRVGLLRLIVERAPMVRSQATDRLVDLLRGESRPLRVPAAVALLRLVRTGVLEPSLLDRIDVHLDADLLRHPDVREERRRLGRGP